MVITVKKAVLWYVTQCSLVDIQDDSGVEVNILGDDSNYHCKKQSSHGHCRILNGYRDTAVSVWLFEAVRCVFVGLE
jgi:hypothetical protein